jgi:hypothetical protein
MHGYVTYRQSQKRDGKIPEATKLRRHLLQRIPVQPDQLKRVMSLETALVRVLQRVGAIW